MQSYYERNREKIKKRASDYYRKNRKVIRAQQNARRLDPAFKAWDRDYQLRKKYGIGQEEYEKLLAEQGGGCAICGGTAPGRKDREVFAVDHDHKTKKVRGLLCVQCNTAVGNLRDSPELLLRALEYLRRNGIQ